MTASALEVARVAAGSEYEAQKVYCFKDDTLMHPHPDKPGYVRCPACGLEAECVDYDAKEIRDDFDALFADLDDDLPPGEEAYPNGDHAPLRKPGSSSGGGATGKAKKLVPGKRYGKPGTLA